MNESKILEHTVEYLKQNIPNFQQDKILFTCPLCLHELPCCNVIPNSGYTLHCFNCNKNFNLIDVIREKKEFKEKSDKEILYHIKQQLKLDILTEYEVDNLLDFYEKLNWDLVPIARGQKIPIERQWTQKIHKDKREWKHWLLEDNLNIGLKCGKASNITVIDLDSDKVLKEFMKHPTLVQKTPNGWQFFYQYEESLPKTRIVEWDLDIENDGGQVVIPPSITDEKRRFWYDDSVEPYDNTLIAPIKMPEELKELLLSKVKFVPKVEKENNFELKEDFHYDLIKEGSRHTILMHLGGIFRKKLSKENTAFVLDVVNKKLSNPPLSTYEFNYVLRSLERYIETDDIELAHKILDYLRIVEVANSRDIRETLGENKEKVEKAIKYLVKEGYLIKKGRTYHIIKKAEWKTELVNAVKFLDFKFPYLHDVANFHYSELLIIGGKTGQGKSHLAMNFVKRLVEQGIKPYLIELEPNKKFLEVALKLGLKEGDFYYDFCDPNSIELEPNAVTIIDWILPKEYSEVDKLFYFYNRQLLKTNGFLIVFMQLRENGNWFAPDLVHFFSSVSVRYLLEPDTQGEYAKFIVDKVNDPKYPYVREIPCKFFRETKEVKRIDEVEEVKKVN